jgi:hypothetical protein
VVDAEAVNDILCRQPQHQTMTAGEDLFVFSANGNELVDVEKAPVIDFVVGRAPIREPIVLCLEDFVNAQRFSVDRLDGLVGDSRIERCGSAGAAASRRKAPRAPEAAPCRESAA